VFKRTYNRQTIIIVGHKLTILLYAQYNNIVIVVAVSVVVVA
jgi:hypothetical protein